MEAIGWAQAYFDGWNDHDSEAIARTFAPGGTYSDPSTNGPMPGARIAEAAEPLFEGFPDVSFEECSVGLVGPSTVAARWVMTGTHLGPFAGLPPTGRTVCLPGADFIEVGPDGITSVAGHYDRQIVSDQLGLKTTAQPDGVGPYRFGEATFLHSGKTARPGGFSMTRLGVRSKRGGEPPSAWPVFEEIRELPGFLSVLGVVIGGDNFTIAAWERPEDAGGMMRLPAHRAAVKEFFSGAADIEGWTSTWAPEKLNALWIRCPSCTQMSQVSEERICSCGAEIPEDARYW